MTFAPDSIKAVRALLKAEDADLSDIELGIVGGPSHVAAGTSYHLGKDQLIMSKNPYSARTARDKAGLSNASSALDVDDDLDELRELSVWVVAQCRAGAPDTLDLREVIYSPDGVQVLQWDRERGVTSLPRSHPDLSHRTHTHFSWYRDSESRDKAGLFRRFFQGDGDDDMTPDQARMLKDIHYAMFEGAGDRRPAGSLTGLASATAAGVGKLGTPPPATVDVKALAAALAPGIEAAAERAVRKVLGAVDGATPDN